MTATLVTGPFPGVCYHFFFICLVTGWIISVESVCILAVLSMEGPWGHSLGCAVLTLEWHWFWQHSLSFPEYIQLLNLITCCFLHCLQQSPGGITCPTTQTHQVPTHLKEYLVGVRVWDVFSPQVVSPKLSPFLVLGQTNQAAVSLCVQWSHKSPSNPLSPHPPSPRAPSGLNIANVCWVVSVFSNSLQSHLEALTVVLL